jgi:hypothetical protein
MGMDGGGFSGSGVVTNRSGLSFRLQETVQHSFGDSRQSRGERQSEPARKPEDVIFFGGDEHSGSRQYPPPMLMSVWLASIS